MHSLDATQYLSFPKKGKKTFWKRILAFPDVIEAFYFIAINPFTEGTVDNDVFKLLERLFMTVCDSDSSLLDINQCRMKLFGKWKQDLELCPPTKDALSQHLKRTIYQASLWTNCLQL